MSEKALGQQETVTIEISLDAAKHYASMADRASFPYRHMTSVCKKALDARQTLYEKWQESRRLPWRQSLTTVYDDSSIKMPDDQIDAMLVAAAPQMLDALLESKKYFDGHRHDYPWKDVTEAIRAALPDDVADEVLGS